MLKKLKKGDTLKIITEIEEGSQCQHNMYGKYCKTLMKKRRDASEASKKILGESGSYCFFYSIVLQSFRNTFFHSTFQFEA
jgi:hypothetical protein